MAHTLFSDDAQTVATKDRAATADMILELAVRDAAPRPHRGRSRARGGPGPASR